MITYMVYVVLIVNGVQLQLWYPTLMMTVMVTHEQFGACQWRPHLSRLPTAITYAPLLVQFNKWQADNPTLSTLIKMSPYLLAIRKYPRVASFHDFPFTQDLIHLLPPNWNNVCLVNGDMGMSVYTGSLLSSHRWNPSMLVSLVNMRSNYCRRVGEKQPNPAPFLALKRIIDYLGKQGKREKRGSVDRPN
jgi:hypothetical protein